MIRATLDTNILASSAIARSGTIAKMLNHWRSGDFELVDSDHILQELNRALLKPYFAARLDRSEREAFVSLLFEFATVVEIEEPVPVVLTDLPDNLVLATALSAGAPYVVSGDHALQGLVIHAGVQIVSASQFLVVIAGAKNTHDAIDP